MRRPLAALATLLAVPALATAQPSLTPAPGAVPVPAVPAYAAPGTVPVAAAAVAEPAPAAELTGIAKRSAEDPAADRAYLARTALIAPSGTISVQARAPLAPGMMGQLSASLGRVEVGVGTIVIGDEGAALGFNAKAQLLRGRRAALAASLDVFSPPDGDDTLYVPSLVASLCADGDACNTLVSVHLTGLGIEGEDEMPVLGGVSWSMGRRGKFVGELHLTDDNGDSILVGYLGGRWGSRKLAFDAGIGFAGDPGSTASGDCIDYCEDSGPDIVPYPFVGLSARM